MAELSGLTGNIIPCLKSHTWQENADEKIPARRTFDSIFRWPETEPRLNLTEIERAKYLLGELENSGVKGAATKFADDLVVYPEDDNAFSIMMTERLYDAIGIPKLDTRQSLERYPAVRFSRVSGAGGNEAVIYDGREAFADIVQMRRAALLKGNSRS